MMQPGCRALLIHICVLASSHHPRRHFLVPLAVAQRPRWRRKGTKLHIYNDHTFVAKHLSGYVVWFSNSRPFTRRTYSKPSPCFANSQWPHVRRVQPFDSATAGQAGLRVSRLPAKMSQTVPRPDTAGVHESDIAVAGTVSICGALRFDWIPHA